MSHLNYKLWKGKKC